MLDVRGKQLESTEPSAPTEQISGPPPVGSSDTTTRSSASQISVDPSSLGSDAKGSQGTTRIFGVDNEDSGRKVLIFWFLIGAIIFGVGFFANFQASSVRAKEAGFSNQIEQAQARLAGGDLDDTIAQLQRIVRQQNTYMDFVDNSIIWSQILLEFSNRVPQNVRITEISFSGNRDVTVRGTGLKYLDVANLSVALKASPIFEEVNIVNSSQSTGSSGVVINFDIRATYKLVTRKNVAGLLEGLGQSSENNQVSEDQ